MRVRCILAARVALLVLVCAPALADETRTVQIQVVGAPEFDVVYHRALTNATGAAIGGLIGAGIQAGVEASQDAKKRDALRPHVGEHVWNDVFVKTFSDALLAKGFQPIWDAHERKRDDAQADVHVVLFPHSYGFRMVDSNTALVSAYVEFDASYAQKKITARAKAPKESFYVTNKKQASYDDLLKEAAGLGGEVESVLAQAARRLANKIIYNVK